MWWLEPGAFSGKVGWAKRGLVRACPPRASAWARRATRAFAHPVGWVSAVPGSSNDIPWNRRVTHHSKPCTVGYAAGAVSVERPCREAPLTHPTSESYSHARRLLARLAGVAAAGALLAGCFQPLYGEYSLANTATTPGGESVAAALSSVDVNQYTVRPGSPEARVAVESRNQLLFDLTGGAAPPPPAYRLAVQMASSRTSVIVDINSGRPDVEDYGLTATYSLTEIKTGKVLFTSTAIARVSYDIPGEAQRFARARGLRDSENRAAKQIADNIRTRLASYFVAGT
jgi:LPS-assembly lipoprotein